MRKQTDAKLLLKAADILKERGHAKGVLCDRKTGKVCLLGAINDAVTGSPYWPTDAARPQKLLGIVAAYLGRSKKGIYIGQDAVAWNNKPKTTKAQVIAALTGAAATIPEAKT